MITDARAMRIKDANTAQDIADMHPMVTLDLPALTEALKVALEELADSRETILQLENEQ